MSDTFQAWLRLNRLGLAGLAGATLSISGLHHLTTPAHVYWPNILQVLYYLPIVLGALLFGWRSGLGLGILAAVSHLPYVLRGAHSSPDYAIEQSVELPLLCMVGVLTGVLSDRARKQRQDLERTTEQLTEVYRELQRNFEQMKRAERLFAVGQLAAGLAHELRNPLWSIAGAAGMLQRNSSLPPKHQECLDIIQKESQRLNRLLTEFLDFARPRPPRYQSINLDALLNSVIRLAAHGLGQGAVELRKETHPALPPVQGDPEMLQQLLLNLVINAIQAMPDGGVVTVSAKLQEGRLLIRVQDEGCGVTPEARDKIFDPFFTTKEGGTGLGLAVAHQIVEQHGGVLTAEANPDRGMAFCVVLPISQEVSA